MTTLNGLPDYSRRDDVIVINSYTTVLRRKRTPREVFATYWRDVHGPLCARMPGLGWYVQNHFHREQDAHLWPEVEGIGCFADYDLDGGVEIGFASAEEQAVFNDNCHLLFADEQNMFDATVAYALPSGSTTLVDRVAEPVPNGDDGLDRIHIHFGPADVEASQFRQFMLDGLARPFAADPAVMKVRLHLPEAYDNARPAPPAPNVFHNVPRERELIAVMELTFVSPMARRAFYASETFSVTVPGQKVHLAFASAFAISGVYTYIRNGGLTLAGLRGSRPAQLIEKLGARNQLEEAIWHLLHTGKPEDQGRRTSYADLSVDRGYVAAAPAS